ncbi:2OG-Fe(II) oxygenase [Paraburkholderia caledonica]|jgi:hypothetical protein|uniref:2OG-Fe(II) oxygenase n=1 Tax=Paraburkholderia caledonica TaxID=134536 RepID=UPI000DEEDEE8|nr:2OG-Fe(II) oxygenase [Paraburkholderia caledonica]AXF13531.1 hypothetical protein CUJ87_03155 [Paraburkholderia caledonica]
MIIEDFVPADLFVHALSTISHIDDWEDARVFRGGNDAVRNVLDKGKRDSLICLPKGAAWEAIRDYVRTDICLKLENTFGVPIPKMTDIQLLRYEVGGHFAPHRDKGGPFPNAQFTVVGGILEAQAGGELYMLEPENTFYRISPGRLIIFPSDTLHGSSPVTRGVKIVFVAWLLER